MTDDIKFLVYKPSSEKTNSEVKKEIEKEKSELASGSASETKNISSSIHCASPKKKNDTKKQKDDDKCKINSLTVKSGKISKTYTIDDENEDPLEIIGGFENEIKTLEFTLDLIGPCSKHNNKTFPRKFKQESNQKLFVKAESHPFYKILDRGTIFPDEKSLMEYDVKASTCSGIISKKIYVYPDVDISIDIPVEWESKKEITNDGLTNTEKHVHESSKKTDNLSIKAIYKEDGKTFEISPKIENAFKKVKNFKKVTDSIVTKLQEMFGKEIKFEILYPVGKIHWDFKYKEKKEPFSVGSEWHLQFNIDPFIGASVTVQVDEALVKLIAAASSSVSAGSGLLLVPLYQKMKSALPDNIEFKIEIILTGTVKVDGGLSKEIDSKTYDGTKGGAGVTGKIELDLKASGKLKILFIISVEGEAGIKSGFEGGGGVYQNSKNLGLDYSLKFLGIKTYWKYSVSGAFQTENKHSTTEKGLGLSESNENTWEEFPEAEFKDRFEFN
jgi:hypothetical protein